MRTLLRDPAAGLMHSMIYFGFLVLLGVTTVLEVDHQLPEDLKFLHGRTYQAYAFVGDAAGVVFLGGIVWAIVRRYVQRPYRIRIKTKAEHALDPRHVPRHRAHRLRRRDVPHRPRAATARHDEEWSFVGYPLSQARRRRVASTRCRTGTRVWWIGHVAVVRRLPRDPARRRCCATCSRRRSTCTSRDRTARRAR